ncbi:MAG TPA: glycosyltransferase family 4 protein [Acidimicrobiales bacterium]|jgi:glycosyltransferase involved in cell wall biosynthesis|nr:glycosyltransferase family 4 protein [Acidimicrobiales bacterium]
MASCAIVSFRLGFADGVSVVAATWQRAFEHLGFTVRTVAGDGVVDVLVPGLAIGADETPTVGEVKAAFDGIDVVVVENLLSIPMNLPASRVVATALAGRPAILHHHDPPWQRERYAHITELPPRDAAWRHVTINELTRAQMAARGFDAVTIYNAFDTSEPRGDRGAARHAMDFAADERVVVHPVRAIARKNVPAAVRLAEALDATYWLSGPAEEGYDAELVHILQDARCRVVHRRLDDRPGLYAASDVVAFPSTWEGFGNPPIEAAIHRRPIAVGDYPVAAELRALGFRWHRPDDVDALRRWFHEPDDALLDTNARLARDNFSLDALHDRLRNLLPSVL